MDFGELEALLGIEHGSVGKMDSSSVVPELVKGVDNKTKELSKQFNESSKKLKNISNSDISIDDLDADRKKIIDESKKIYEISVRLLEKLEKDITDKIVSDPKLWASAGPLLNAVNNNLKTLAEINARYRQEEEMKKMTMMAQEGSNDSGLPLTWDQVSEWLEKKKEKEGIKESDEITNANDAILIEGEPKPFVEEEEEEANNE